MAWEAQNDNWAKPKYDGFRLATDNIPTGDAALHGGVAGEEAYQYFLKAAEDAAQSATSAMDKAVENLKAEAIDQQALANAEAKAAALSDEELLAVCGRDRCRSQPSGSLPRPKLEIPCGRKVYFGNIPVCDLDRLPYRQVLGIATDRDFDKDVSKNYWPAPEVRAELDRATPRFTKYDGGELQGLFVEQWTAWKQLENTLDKAIAVDNANDAAQAAADAEVTAAEAEYSSAEADVAWAEAEVGGQLNQLQNQRQEYIEKKQEYDAAYTAARLAKEALCDDLEAEWDAIQAGYSYTLDTCGDPGEGSCSDLFFSDGLVEVHGNTDGVAYNPGPHLAYLQRCEDARREWDRMQAAFGEYDPDDPEADQHSTRGAMDNYVADLAHLYEQLHGQLDTNGDGRIDEDDEDNMFDRRLQAALRRRDAAVSRSMATRYQSHVQNSDMVMDLQAAQSRLFASYAAVKMAYTKRDNAVARVNLERTLEVNTIQTRFGLRSMYNSYDLWRARALAENARRLAVTARRAIEGRFVVSLSDMEAPEPFVEAPSLWADEIFDPDLKPLSALGLTAAPENTTGTYTNRLTDYVMFEHDLSENRFTLFHHAFLLEHDLFRKPVPLFGIML